MRNGNQDLNNSGALSQWPWGDQASQKGQLVVPSSTQNPESMRDSVSPPNQGAIYYFLHGSGMNLTAPTDKTRLPNIDSQASSVRKFLGGGVKSQREDGSEHSFAHNRRNSTDGTMNNKAKRLSQPIMQSKAAVIPLGASSAAAGFHSTSQGVQGQPGEHGTRRQDIVKGRRKLLAPGMSGQIFTPGSSPNMV